MDDEPPIPEIKHSVFAVWRWPIWVWGFIGCPFIIGNAISGGRFAKYFNDYIANVIVKFFL